MAWGDKDSRGQGVKWKQLSILVLEPLNPGPLEPLRPKKDQTKVLAWRRGFFSPFPEGDNKDIHMKYWRKPLDYEDIKIPRGKVSIIEDRCKGCSFCAEYCPRDVLEMSEDRKSVV